MLLINHLSDDTRFDMDADYLWNDGAPFDENYVIVSHDDNGTDHDIEVVFFEDDGTVKWSDFYDGDDEDYGVKVVCDEANDYVYIIGTTTKTASKEDLIVRKYAAGNGTLQWTTTWDAGSNEGEIPVDALLHNGDLFITGVANHGHWEETNDDIFTLKVAADGSVLWSDLYDYSGYGDNPIGLEKTSTHLFVAGSSYQNATTRNVLLLKYSFTGGTPSIWREGSSNLEFATDFLIDGNNLYVTGRKSVSGDFDAALYQYNDQLTLNWTYTYNYQDRVDRGVGVFIAEGNPYLVAECIDNNRGTAMVLCRVNPSTGALKKVRYYEPHTPKGKIKLRRICQPNSDHPIALIQRKEEGGVAEGVALFFRKTSGHLRGYQVSSENELYLNAANWKSGYFYFNGVEKVSGVYKTITGFNETVTYQPRLQTDTVTWTEYDTINYSDTVRYVTNKLSVMFESDAVKTTFTDNLDLEFGRIDDVFIQSVADTLDSLFTYSDSLIVIKQNPGFTSADTMDTNYYGGAFRTLNHHNNMYLVFANSEGVHDVKKDISSRDFSEYSRVITLPRVDGAEPDDEHYDDIQFNLHTNSSSSNWNSDFLKGNMNMEEAWALETGNPAVNVGVTDRGPIFYKHEDFSYNKTLAQSAIKTGGFIWRYDPSNFSSYDGHATRVAGIIGATRNNDLGVAGIAGGTGKNVDGVSIYSLKMNFRYDYFYYNEIRDSNIHIVNQSWESSRVSGAARYESYIDLVKKGVVFISSRGNDTFGRNNADQYPSKFFPSQSISVGAHGHDGNIWKPHNERGWDPSNDGNNNYNKAKFWSKYGGELDFLAPGWVSPYNGQLGGTPEVGCYTTDVESGLEEPATDDYSTATQTSTAAPHVVGLAALLVSGRYDHAKDANTLTVEDIEKLIAMSCRDIKASDEKDLQLNADHRVLNRTSSHPYNRPMPSNGFDELTGWGQVDAGKAMYYAGIKDGQGNADFDLLHFTQDDDELTLISTSYSLEETDIPVCLSNEPDAEKVGYKVSRYRVELVVEVDIPTGYNLFSPSWFSRNGVTQGGIWQNSVVSNLMQPNEEVTVWNSTFEFLSPNMPYLAAKSLKYNDKRVTLYGYAYKLTHYRSGGPWQPMSSGWYFPFSPSNTVAEAKYGVTVHVVKQGVSVDQKFRVEDLSVFPNPARDWVSVKIASGAQVKGQLDLIDNGGRVLESKNLSTQSALMVDGFDLSGLPHGLYAIRWTSSHSVETRKFLKL